jgi:flagellar basal-body rod protein FlgC
MAELSTIFSIANAALQAQSMRMRVVAENIANAATTPTSPDEQPYQRKVVTFKNEFDRALGVNQVRVSGVVADTSPFNKRYEPSHPAADAQGYVQTPNVKTILETMDMREAQRSYEANINVIDAARSMLLRTIDLLRN